MFKSLFKILLLILIIINITSCNTNKEIDSTNIYTYEYNFESYGIKDSKLFKASTVATLNSVINNKKTAIFIVSSPLCTSCRKILEELVDVSTNSELTIYNIDPYSDIYPVYGDDSFNDLLNILQEIGINNENDIVLPIILIINKGNIDGYLKGDTLHDTNASSTKESIKELLSKSLIY